MYIGEYCPGCGGGTGDRACAIARAVSYCCHCAQYPCGRHGRDEYDSFISYQNRRRDMERWKTDPEAYCLALEEKAAILRRLLEEYNDGRRKSLFCQAANLLALEDLRGVMAAPDGQEHGGRKSRAAAAGLLEQAAGQSGVCLKLRKKN